jgi:hypothetical protein
MQVEIDSFVDVSMHIQGATAATRAAIVEYIDSRAKPTRAKLTAVECQQINEIFVHSAARASPEEEDGVEEKCTPTLLPGGWRDRESLRTMTRLMLLAARKHDRVSSEQWVCVVVCERSCVGVRVV